MRPKSTPQEETCQWPVSVHPGWTETLDSNPGLKLKQPRRLKPPSPAGPWSPSVPLPHFCLWFDAWDERAP